MNTSSTPLHDDTPDPNKPPDQQTPVVLPQTTSSDVSPRTAGPIPPSHGVGHADPLRPSPGSNVERIYGISDCVIAVAFTLFIENIRLPPAGLSPSGLQSFVLHDMVRDIAFYCGTYLVVASSWISHYRIFTYLQSSNSSLIVLNIVFLSSIVFLPVPIALFYHYTNQAEVWQLFAATQAVTSATLLLLWLVAQADQLLDHSMPVEYQRTLTLRLILIVVGTLLSFVLAFWNVIVAQGTFLALFVLSWILHALAYRYHHGTGKLAGTVRMCSITDNMTAVALTFLIVTIVSAGATASHQSFSQTLSAIGAELPLYSITFLVVGLYWLSHHRFFMLIRRHDIALIWLNFAFLLCIELQPQFNALRSTYPTSPLTASLYAANQALCGLLLLSIWLYAALRHRLIDPALARAQSLSIGWRALATPLLFLLSLAVVYFRNDYVVPFWLLIVGVELAGVLLHRVRRGPYQVHQTPAQV